MIMSCDSEHRNGRQVGSAVRIDEVTPRRREAVGILRVARSVRRLVDEHAGFLLGTNRVIRGFGGESSDSPVFQTDSIHLAVVGIEAGFAFVRGDINKAMRSIEMQDVANRPGSGGDTPLQTAGRAVVKIEVTEAVALGKPQDITISEYIDHGALPQTVRFDECIAGFGQELARCTVAGFNELQTHALRVARARYQVHTRAVGRPPSIAGVDRCKE